MQVKDFDDGSSCPKCIKGFLGIEPSSRLCTCHISPPCFYCETSKLTCNHCLWSEWEGFNDIETPFISVEAFIVFPPDHLVKFNLAKWGERLVWIEDRETYLNVSLLLPRLNLDFNSTREMIVISGQSVIPFMEGDLERLVYD